MMCPKKRRESEHRMSHELGGIDQYPCICVPDDLSHLTVKSWPPYSSKISWVVVYSVVNLFLMTLILRPLFFLKNSDRTQSVVPTPPTRYYWLDFLLWNHKREISNFSQLKMKEIILPDISKMAMSCDEYFQGDLWYDILESFAVQKIKNEQQMSIQQ